MQILMNVLACPQLAPSSKGHAVNIVLVNFYHTLYIISYVVNHFSTMQACIRCRCLGTPHLPLSVFMLPQIIHSHSQTILTAFQLCLHMG